MLDTVHCPMVKTCWNSLRLETDREKEEAALVGLLGEASHLPGSEAIRTPKRFGVLASRGGQCPQYQSRL